LQAEAQRAKSEIEAALTIAAARPRDEKRCMDEILISCQRPGVAESAEYEYAKGGTPITGATIKLLELVAQKWHNIDFGFRELARYPGENGKPGESIVEAYAWDLETNTRRKAQFTVQHALGLKGGRTKVLTDPRDIYEMIANQAMRRVRTCLENVIPRDIVEAAREEARKTLATNEAITPQKIAALLKAFSDYNVTKDQIEKRLQRRIDGITPAQMVQLRRIYTSLRDGMGESSDWFDADATAEQPKTVAEAAKEKMRRQQAAPKAQEERPASSPPADVPPAEVAPAPHNEPIVAEVHAADEPQDAPPVVDAAAIVAKWKAEIDGAKTLKDVNTLVTRATNSDEVSGLPAASANYLRELVQGRQTILRQQKAAGGQQTLV
jgi:hypothetical protein